MRLIRIKQLVMAGRLRFTYKARTEASDDNLTTEEVRESILNAQYLRTKKSTSPHRRGFGEILYIIDSFSFHGIAIYSKGVIRQAEDHEEEYYILISGKRSTPSD